MERLKQLRLERKLTTQDMADFLNVSKGSYNYYELGKTEPSIEKLKKLADFFCVSVDYLISANSRPGDYSSISLDEWNFILKLRSLDVRHAQVLKMQLDTLIELQTDSLKK